MGKINKIKGKARKEKPRKKYQTQKEVALSLPRSVFRPLSHANESNELTQSRGKYPKFGDENIIMKLRNEQRRERETHPEISQRKMFNGVASFVSSIKVVNGKNFEEVEKL